LKEVVSEFAESANITGELKVDTITTTGNVDISGSLNVETSLTTKDLFVNESLNVDNVITYEKYKQFNTIVIRTEDETLRETINFNELQLWVNDENVLALNSSSLDGYFAIWSNKDVPVDPVVNGDIVRSINNFLFNEDILSSGEAIAIDVNAVIINNVPLTSINDIQSLVLYNRIAPSSVTDRIIGMVVELYNTDDDPSLLVPLSTTTAISVGNRRYRYDYPSIDTYTLGFSTGDSITQVPAIGSSDTISDVAIVNVFDPVVDISGGLKVDTITLPTIGDVETAIQGKQPTITKDTDLTCNSLTTNNILSETFDTIVLRRPTGIPGGDGAPASYAIILNELQCWVNASNILIDVNTSSYFADWVVDKDVDIGQYQDNVSSNAHNNIIEAGFSSVSPLDTGENSALLISGFPKTEITKIQSMILYNRQDGSNTRLVGVALELYSRENDVNLVNPLASSNEISVARNVYRFDFPSISSYTAGFSASNSTTAIANDTLALKEVISYSGSNISCGTLITSGNATIGGTLSVTGDLTSNSITTIGNADIGGNVSITGSLSNPKQPAFRAVSGVSFAFPTNFPLKYGISIVDNEGSYSTSTGEYTIRKAGNWYFYYSFQSDGVAFKVQLQQNGVIRDQVFTDTAPTLNTDLGCKGMAVIPCLVDDVIRVFVVTGPVRLENADQFHSFGGFLIG